MQQQTQVFDDECVRILLIGSEDDIARAFSLIDEHLRKPMCAWIRERFPGMSSEDLADTWAEVLTNILQAVRAGRFDPDSTLIPFICQLARARAIDRIRRRTSLDAIIQAIGAALQGTAIGDYWRGMDVVDRRECMRAIRLAIAPLPRKQRIVLQEFCDGFPDTRSMEVLRKAVSDLTGTEETSASVKRALQEGRSKVRKSLELNGYGLGERGDQ